MRLERVLNIVQRQRILAGFRKGRPVKVVAHRGHRSLLVPPMVVRLTRLMAADGIDAHKCDKALVLSYAIRVAPYLFSDSH